MSTPRLPSPIDRFVDAVNRHDQAAFLAFFPPTGVVDDWGRRFQGHAAIKQWSDKEFIGAKGTITPRDVSATGNVVRLEAGWKSSFFSGDSTFIFKIENGLIEEMRIPAH